MQSCYTRKIESKPLVVWKGRNESGGLNDNMMVRLSKAKNVQVKKLTLENKCKRAIGHKANVWK